MTLTEMIRFLKDCQDSHEYWAEVFEEDPDMEAAYTSTDEWDDAKTHREMVGKYAEIIRHLQDHPFKES